MAELNDKKKRPAVGETAMPKPPRPHGEGSTRSLFVESGPVTLGAQQPSVVALGDIRSRQQASLLGTRTPSQPAAPIPPPAPKAPTEGVAAATAPREPITQSGSTSWSPTPYRPRIDRSAYIHPMAAVIGNVTVGPNVFISAGAIIRGENEEPIYIGENSTIQEGVVVRDLPTRREGQIDRRRLVEVDGRSYSVYIGKGVSICAQAQVHGPAHVADGVYLGMQTLVFWARVDEGVVVEPACLIMNVSIPSGIFVPAGLKVTSQRVVDDLPPLSEQYRFYGIGAEAAAESGEMVVGYRSLGQ